MYPELVLPIVKGRLGISTEARDGYLTSIIQGVVDELNYQLGIKLNEARFDHVMFVADYAEYRYSNRDTPRNQNGRGEMPRHLQWRLHNLVVDNDVRP